MASNDEKEGDSSQQALDRALDEADFNMASLQLKPDEPNDDDDKMLIEPQQPTPPSSPSSSSSDNDTLLLTAQFDLFKHLVRKAGALTEAVILTNPTLTTLQEDFRNLVELAELIDRVEGDGYMGTEEEERTLQSSPDVLIAAYGRKPEVAERKRGVVAVEREVGYRGRGRGRC